MARALIVGCGCRGRELAGALTRTGWIVRGTTRDEASLPVIEAAGIEAVLADPDRVGSVLEQVEGVAAVVWLMGSPRGEQDAVAAVNGPRLERMLEKLVDSPVRAFVYEAAGSAPIEQLRTGAELVREAGERWRIPVRVVDTPPEPVGPWCDAFAGAVAELIAG